MKSRTVLAIAVVATALGALTGDATAHPSSAHRGHVATATERGLAVVREATAKYHDVARARRDGYVQVSGCVALPGVGGMGYHFLNPALASDTRVDPRRPELLVYEPKRGGGLRLGAVEWFVVDADGDVNTDDDRPSVLGQPFDGPLPGHDAGMPVHYELHAWVWKHNPTGVFSPWNPRVSCP